ncbi:gamma-glutamylcyclotransferase family protein [Pedobacter cryoconitis]|uniref:Gamma-glutamylcyclotransferase (GGCT)/AIG2-like uncharacterized protein YtfP n=1 Tax=Pedobacter cryoconitis TaxID=188932 RepID=A0A327SVD4_9SPHI|nr:gamma-glutamylcyclotransferase family protein [Pedobacter cryoconitis]RAJ32878.1 gamma-glutamylcyclotransferase (GGCT)/AIG2-like uncharacterized protein YtfP [Pedobacter cryoconitis]
MNTEKLFSYGTLQNESVQIKNYGRTLEGKLDKLTGYALSMIEITDAAVVALSGAAHHPMVKHTGIVTDTVDGMVFEISADELKRTDEYEVDDYKRVEVILESGKKAWVYVNV